MSYLSYSRIWAYLLCPYRFRLQYVEGIRPPTNAQMSLGSSLHAALREFHSQKSLPRLDDLFSFYQRSWFKYGYRSSEQEAKHFEEGLLILKKYYELNSESFRPALWVEKRFSVNIEGVRVVGVVDRIDDLRRGYRILDYKTSRGKDGHDETQLDLYYLAMEKAFGCSPQELSFYFLKEQEQVNVQISSDKLAELRTLLPRLKAKIEQGDFPQNKGEKCNTCDYRVFCRLEEGSSLGF